MDAPIYRAEQGIENEKGAVIIVSVIRSMGLVGVGGYEVAAECHLASGLPHFEIVGLPDAAVREARERVRSAARNSGFSFPVSRVTVNLAPADTKKGGTVYDLPMLISILAAAGDIGQPGTDAAFIGELSLGGDVRGVPGALPMVMAAARGGVREVFVPADNAAEAALVEGVTVYPVKTVGELAAHLAGREKLAPQPPTAFPEDIRHRLDFADVKGQENVKRALEVAAAGGHNILMRGYPGAGKSMLAKRLPSILPDMSRDEAMEATEIHSVMGLTTAERPMLTERPFRSPHSSTSAQALAGGGAGAVPRPGEMSLAHNGVLFLDELPEFRRDAIEILRQPIEDGEITISRAAGTLTFPTRFMLVAAMNPCRCGWHGHPSGRCRCGEVNVQKYRARISGPLMDRIDIYIDVPSLAYDELEKKPDGEPSGAIRARVNAAREIQRRRLGGNAGCNARMSPAEITAFCELDDKGRALMKSAFDRLGMTARSYDKILRVARTIADLAGAEGIGARHLAEAIQYREINSGG